MPKGVSTTPLQKTIFPVEFFEIAPLIEYVKLWLSAKNKVEKSLPFQNDGHFTDFPEITDFPVIEKPLSRISTKFGSK